jgi:NADH:ubiquinone oxidoreductase subunit 5 (subunit L)/multisubunit Na+/H+ antiporter MnhA subunit
MILDAAEAGDFFSGIFYLGLYIGVFLTGMYTGRLFFAVFHGPKRFLGHIHEPGGVMLWPLVPLAFGAIFLGYLNWPVPLLAELLATTVGVAEPFVPSIMTVIAGAIGLAGFLLAPWFFKPQVAVQPAPAVAPAGAYEGEHETEYVEPLEPNVGWSDWLADVSYGVANFIARIQGGHLGRYVFVSVLGIAAILLVTLGVTQSIMGAR